MVTLDRLVNVLGSYGVRLRFCPIPRSTELRSVILHEVTEDRTVVGDVLLGIGARSVKEAVRWAASAHAVVVLIRGGDNDTAYGGADEGVAVMVVDPAVSWSELAAVIYGLVLEGRETESGRGPTDLFALADSLADATGGAVTIEDRLSRVLAYSKLQQHADPARVATIIGRQAPEHLRAFFDARGVFAHLVASDDPLFVAEDADLGLDRAHGGRGALGTRADGIGMGGVFGAVARAARTALADGARTVALHLLRSRASADLERQVESELVIRLLEGTADAATAASRLGLPHNPLRVIAVQAFIGAERDAALLLAFERATTGFGWSRPGRSALAGNTVYTLLPGEQAETARRWVTGLGAALPDGVTMLGRHQRRRRGGGPPHGTSRGRRVSGACTRAQAPAPRLRPTTSRGTTSCCSGCARPRGQVAPQTGAGSRVASPRPRPRHRIRGDAAGLAGGPGRPRRGRRAVGRAREHRALPAAQDGRDRQPPPGRRQKAAGHDDRTRCYRHRLTMRAVETRQSTAASLSSYGKPYGGHPHHHGDNRWWSCGGG